MANLEQLKTLIEAIEKNNRSIAANDVCSKKVRELRKAEANAMRFVLLMLTDEEFFEDTKRIYL